MQEPRTASSHGESTASSDSFARRLRNALAGTYSRGLARLAKPITRDIHADVSATMQRQLRLQHRETRETNLESYHQVEALVGLYATLDIKVPLPRMRRYAISPDFACELVQLIATLKPELVVELGSGVSTLISGYALRRNGHGRVVSLEHEASWHEKSCDLVSQHGLDSVAKVLHAPLTPVSLDEQQWTWYDTGAIASLDSIDLLVVDGPPGHTGPLARYPALPLLLEKLAPKATILLDDTNREDEQRIISRWDQEFGPFSIESLSTEKGAVVLRR